MAKLLDHLVIVTSFDEVNAAIVGQSSGVRLRSGLDEAEASPCGNVAPLGPMMQSIRFSFGVVRSVVGKGRYTISYYR